MKNLRIFFIIGLLVVLVSSSLVTAAPKIRIGFSLATLQEERWQKDRDFFREEAERLGAQVLVQGANNDDALQISQCENLLSQGVDALVIVAHDGEACAAIVESAHKAKVPCIAYDRLIMNCDLDLYVSFDNERVGYLQAMGVLEKVSSGNFVYIGGSPTDNNAYLVKSGSMKALQPLIDQGKINIVYDQFTNNWDPSIAQTNMENALTMLGNKVDAVVAANDGTAGGVIQALTDQKLDGKVPVSGQDADLAACQRIVEGTQTVTVYKPIKSIAIASAQAAVKLAKGEKVDANLTANNGKIDVPYLALDPVPVYKENMYDVIIKDDFHELKDVYRNIPKKDWPAQK